MSDSPEKCDEDDDTETDDIYRRRAIEVAREQYALGSDNDVEIDDDAELSELGDGSTWVQAWVFVRREDLGIEADEDEDDTDSIYQ